MPFYLIPGDLLILGPILYFVDQNALSTVGVDAVNGGLIPWQAGIETSFGRIQFVLGREIGVYLFGRTKERDAMFYFSPEVGLTIISYRSTQLEFPFLEYRPFKSYEVAQRSSMFLQFYFGVDIPHNVEDIGELEENPPPPELKNVWYLGTRILFDWRHYF
jgi:hypothetical protein